MVDIEEWTRRKTEETAVLETLPSTETRSATTTSTAQVYTDNYVEGQPPSSFSTEQEGVRNANTLTEEQVQETDKVCSINTVAEQSAEV